MAATVLKRRLVMRKKLDFTDWTRDAELFRQSFRASVHLGDRTVELSGLSMDDYCAGSRVMEKVYGVLTTLDPSKRLTFGETRRRLVAIDGYGIGVFSAKNVAMALARVGWCTDSPTDDEAEDEADEFKFFATNPKECLTTLCGNSTKAIVTPYLEKCRFILSCFDDSRKYASAHVLFANVCKAWQSHKCCASGSIPGPKLRLGSVADSAA